MTGADPAGALLGNASSLRFRISEEMVARFAALTGDRSSLHVDDAFARRSAYRRPVVHGMLPLGFLAALSPLAVGAFECLPTAVTGRFVSPVYAGDLLILTVTPQQISGESRQFTFDYRIEHQDSRRLATLGTVTYVPLARPRRSRFPKPADACMLLRPVELRNLLIEQIDVGTKDSIDFQVTEDSLSAFVELLAMGIGDANAPQLAELKEQLGTPTLLAVLLFSTSVGVSLPGASATFLEFSAHSLSPVELDTIYRLQGTVIHRSMATRIIKKELVVCRGGSDNDIVMRGKAATLVNKPSQRMPTVLELRESAIALGLEGKVALVTGASRGIGETTAKVLALAGAKVIVNYHRGAEDAGRVVRDITSAGGEAIAVAADVTSSDEVQALFQCGIERFGAIDVLVNNAARDFRPIPFLQLTWDEIQQDLDVIAKGAFLCCRYAIPFMLERGRGKIINISSVATDDPPPGQAKYVMAKSALVGLTRSLSIEFASRNIQVNLVVPHFVETDLVAHVAEGFRKKIAQDTPMQRHASAVEVAHAVLYLASSLSSFTTGQKIMVTGGGAPYA